MAPVVTRELRITYGGTTVGGTSDYLLDSGDEGDDRIVIDRTFDRTAVRFFVLSAGHATDLAANTAWAALEAAFTRPRQRLRIQQGPLFAETLLDLDPAAASGIEVQAQISKVGGPHDTGRSRRYLVTIVSGNPANQTVAIAGEAGLRSFRSRVRYLPSRLRVLEVSGTYTKLASSTAEAQYQDQIATRVGAITTALTGKWELVDESYEPNLENSLVDFSQTWEELILRQSLAVAMDDPNVARQRLTVRIGEDAPGDAAGALRLVAVAVEYEAWILKTVTDLPAWWASTGLPWLVSHAQSTAQASAVALVRRSVQYGEQNVIRASLLLMAATGGTTLERRITTTDLVRLGKRFVPAWNGDPLAAYVFQGPREVYRTVTVTERVLGTVTPADPSGGGRSGRIGATFGFGGELELSFTAAADPADAPRAGSSIAGTVFRGEEEPGGAPGGGGVAGGAPAYTDIESQESYTPLTIGLRGHQLPVTDITRTTTARLIVQLPAAGPLGGGSGGGTGGGTRARAGGAA